MQAHAEQASLEQVPWPSATEQDRDAVPPTEVGAPDDGLFATVRGVSLVDLLQMYHLARGSVVLRCADQTRIGEIHLSCGEVVHAYTAGRRGRIALRQLLGLRAGLVTSEPAECHAPQSIDEPLQALLLDLLREIDEESQRDRRRRAPPTPLPRKTVPTPVALRCVPLTLRADQAAFRTAPNALDHGYPWDNLRIDDPELCALTRRAAPLAPKEPRTMLGSWIGLAALWVSALGFVAGLLG